MNHIAYMTHIIFGLMLAITTLSGFAQEAKPDSVAVKAPEVKGDSLAISTYQLDELIVTPDETTQTLEKVTATITPAVRKHSADGYSLLSQVPLPGINVDIFSKKVTAYNSGVLLCINGVESSKEEVQTINPKDVIRVDYYSGYNPEYPTSSYVIDFIVNIPEGGGAFNISATNNLDTPVGEGFVDWRTFRKNNEFGLRVDPNYNLFTGSYSNTLSNYFFDDTSISRLQSSTPLSLKNLQLKGSTYFVHRHKAGMFKATLALTGLRNNRTSETAEEITTGENVSSYSTSTVNNRDRLQPSLNVYYNYKFKNRSNLAITFYSDYSKTDGTRIHTTPTDETPSNTRENLYTIKPRIRYTLPIRRKHSIFTEATLNYRNSNQHYEESEKQTETDITQIRFDLALGTNLRLAKKFSLYLDARFRLNYKNQNETSNYKDPNSKIEREYFLTPKARISWRLPQNNVLKLEVGGQSETPWLSMYSTTVKKIDKFLSRTGNPNLKTPVKYSANFILTSTHQWGYFEGTAGYSLTTDPVYLDIVRDGDKNRYLQTYTNGGNYGRLNVNAQAQVNVIPNLLRIKAGVDYYHTDLHTWHAIHDNSLRANMTASFMLRGWSAQLRLLTAQKEILPSGEWDRDPMRLNLTVGYTISNFAVNLFTSNPLMKACTKHHGAWPGYQTTTRSYAPHTAYNYFALSLSYRFTYGNRHHTYQDLDPQQPADSGILDH